MKKFLLFICLLTLPLVACSLKPGWLPYDSTKKEVYPNKQWQKVEKPEKLGWSSAKLTEAQVYSKKIGSAAVMIVENGVVIDAWGDVRRRFQCHSMRKSLLSGLIGIHVDEGNIDLSKTMAELGIDDYPPSLTAEEKKATVRDLIKARSGIYHPALGEAPGMKKMRPKRHSHAPGTFWYYNNWDFNALGTIFTQETGQNIYKDFEKRIAKPLQMEDFNVGYCRLLTSADYPNSPPSMHRYYLFRVSARDLARFGLLFLREGRWKDQQIISPQWIRESTASFSQRGNDGGYGYMWWTGINRGLLPNINVKGHSYYAAGWGGHRVFVLPYRNLVVVHRVDTDSQGSRPGDHHIGRLLWMILSAAGEAGIGENPSLEAAAGARLRTDDLNKLLVNGCRWVAPNNGLFPGGKTLVLTCSKDGALSLSASDKLEFKGRWWISKDRFYFKIIGIRDYFRIVKEGDTLKMFDATGTLYSNFQQS